jgi:peptidoglycan/xylan/chitin deacetylase (PgdA/CDA1 family)
MHDSATTGMTAEALPDIIAWYRDQGYAFCTVNDLYTDPD